MAKEIHEQPEVVGHTLAHYLDFATGRVAVAGGLHRRFRRPRPAVDHRVRHGLLRRPRRQILVRAVRAACPVDIDIASEFRYREQPLTPERPRHRHLAVGRDRRHAGLAALRQGARARRSRRSSTCASSTIAREADFVLPTLAGPEIGVASTKAFTCQLVACWRRSPLPRAGRAAARSRPPTRRSWSAALSEVPRLMSEALAPGAEDRGAGPRPRRMSTTCSISAAAPATRSRWRAR